MKESNASADDFEGLSATERLIRLGAYLTKQKFTAGSLVHLSDASGQILLVRQRARQRKRWGLPGGFVKQGEDFLEAARRELAEEVGIQVWTLTVVDQYRQPWANHFEAVLRGNVHERDAIASCFEIIEARWFDPEPASLPALTRETGYALQRMTRRAVR